MDTKKMVRVNNVIDFHADAKDLLKKNSEKRSEKNMPQIVQGLGQPSRKIDFLNGQLGNAKNELAMFRQNHNALVEQIVFVQKDFKRRLRIASEDKRASEEKYKKAAAAYQKKEKELFSSNKQLNELKEKFNQLHIAYAEKIDRFKNQHKARIGDKETAAEKKINLLNIEREKLQKNVSCLMDAVYQRSEKITVLEKGVKGLRENVADLKSTNELLEAFKKENIHTVSNLKSDLEVLRGELNVSIRQHKEKEKEADILNYKLTAVNEDFEASSARNDEYQQKILQLKNDIEGKKAKMEAYEETINDLRASGVEASRLADEIRNHQITEASLRNDLKTLEDKEESQALRIKEQEETIEDFRNRTNKLQAHLSKLNAEFAEAKRGFEDKIKSLEAQNIDLGKRESKLIASMEQVNITLADKDKSIIEQKNQNTELRKENKEVSEARQAVERKYFELESLEKEQLSEISDLKRNIASLKTGMDQKLDKIDELHIKLDDMESKNEKLTAEYLALEEHVAVLTSELNAASEQNHASLGSINSYNEKVTGLSGEILDLKEEKDSLNSQIQDLKSDVDSERKKYEDLEKEFAEKMDLLEASKNKEADFVEARQDWADSKEAFELRIAGLIAEIEDKDQEILNKQNAIEDYITQFRDLNAELDQAKQTVSDTESERLLLIRNKDSLLSKNENLQYLKSQLENELKEKEGVIAGLEGQIEDFEKRTFGFEQQIESLDKRFVEAKDLQGAKESDLKEELEYLKKRQQDLQLEKKDKEMEISNLKLSLERLEEDYAQSQKEISTYQEKVSGADDEISTVEEGRFELLQALEKKNDEFNKLTSLFTEEKEKFKALELKLDAKVQEIEDLKEENNDQKVSIVSHRDMQDKIEILQAKEKDFEEEIVKRREELGLYSRWVDSQKESLKNHIVRFSQELKLSLTINPLHSYLAMTEKELDKVEVLLAKPGVLGEQRVHLEGHHKILIDQKKYITELIDKTTQDMEKRVGEVMGLLKQGEFIPVPPLPPGK